MGSVLHDSKSASCVLELVTSHFVGFLFRTFELKQLISEDFGGFLCMTFEPKRLILEDFGGFLFMI